MLGIIEACDYEIEKIKGSRFIGYAFPLVSLDEFDQALQIVKLKYASARHYCWAYQGRGKDDYRYSDDGEPSGTAGKPILQVIQGKGLSNTLVIVVRYFGGTKLGTGGLARAYASASKQVLDLCDIIEMKKHVDLEMRISYSFEAIFQHFLKQFEAHCLTLDYSDQVSIKMRILSE